MCKTTNRHWQRIKTQRGEQLHGKCNEKLVLCFIKAALNLPGAHIVLLPCPGRRQEGYICALLLPRKRLAPFQTSQGKRKVRDKSEIVALLFL